MGKKTVKFSKFDRVSKTDENNNDVFVKWKAPSIAKDQVGVKHYEVKLQYHTDRFTNEWIDPPSNTTVTNKETTLTAPQSSTWVRVGVKPVSKSKTSKLKAWKGDWAYTGELESPWFQNETARMEREGKEEEARTAAAMIAAPAAPSMSGATYVASSNSIRIQFTNSAQYSDLTYIRKYMDDASQSSNAYSDIAVLNKSITEYVMPNVEAGHKYRFCAVAHNGNKGASPWSGLSNFTDWVEAPPVAPSKLSAQSTAELSVNLKWTDGGYTGDHYDVVYSYIKEEVELYPSTSSRVQHYEFDALPVGGGQSCSINIDDGGKTWYFRVRRRSSNGWSAWSPMISAVIGKTPSAPVTYSTQPYISDGTALLRWSYVNVDGSEQSAAQIQVRVGTSAPAVINVTGDAQSYEMSLTGIANGTGVAWRVRCKGVIDTWGELSSTKTFTVVSEPTLVVGDGSANGTISTYPVTITATSDAQSRPVSFYAQLACTADTETTMPDGTTTIYREGTVVWSEQLEPTGTGATFEILPVDVMLEDGTSYMLSVTVANAYGLRKTVNRTLTTSFADSVVAVFGSAEFDEESLTATLAPACYDLELVETYEETDDESPQQGKTYYTRSGDVYTEFTGSTFASGTTYYEMEMDYEEDEEGYPALGELSDCTLSVWRADAYNNWDLIAKDIENTGAVAVVDPYPTLGTCNYRICAVDNTTGVLEYDDDEVESHVNRIVIDMDSEWKPADDEFETTRRFTSDRVELPYNIKVSEESDPDAVELELWGDDAPTLRNGTHLRIGGSWSCDMVKSESDETLAGLRRLMAHPGSVYVREPSGIGYWARCKVSISRSYDSQAVSVSLSVTRVKSPYEVEGVVSE